MDCRTCEPTLIDLVHSELATDAAREAHAHLATCATCRASFDTLMAATRLAAELPMVEPPAHIAARVMQLAEEHAREAAARQRVAAPRPTPWQALLDFVGRLATRPQVAMSTIMVLIVAVGLWSLPRLRREPAVAGVVVNPEPEGEAAPGTGVEPAERLDLKVDMRAGRIRSKDGVPVAMPTAAAAPAVPAAQPTSPAADEALAARDKNADDPLATLDDVDLGESTRKPAAKEAGSALQPAKRTSSGMGSGTVGGREFAKSPPVTRPAPASAAPPPPSPSVDRFAQGPDLRKAEPAAEAERAANADADSLGALARRAPSGGNAQGAGAAEPKLEAKSKASATTAASSNAVAHAAPASKAPASLAQQLTSARARAKQSGCSVALPDYQRLVQQSPNSAEAGSALIEMAQCRRNAGDIAVARSLLQRAAAIPEVAGRARALLASLASPTAK